MSLFDGTQYHSEVLAGGHTDKPKVKKISTELHDYRHHQLALQWFTEKNPPLPGVYDGTHPRNVVAEAMHREVSRLAGLLDRAWAFAGTTRAGREG